MCKNLIYENTPSKQSTFDIYIYMFHDKQARDEKKRIYGYNNFNNYIHEHKFSGFRTCK